ncbi:MAG: leucyl/phenylalanyl-tRNA--protein transferase [Dokdonella sp.]
MQLPILDPFSLQAFPIVGHALRQPNGLLATGGDLSVDRLLLAYRNGIFPWYSAGEPILWWSPDPRMIFHTDRIHVSRRLARSLRSCPWKVRADTAFRDVMRACAQPRPDQPTTWINTEMLAAYGQLHDTGHAHSVEVFDDETLIGGIYGVAIGRMFFGESMFGNVTGASKAALLALCHALELWRWPLLDAQVQSDHLETLGAQLMPRREFIGNIENLVEQPGEIGSWTERFPMIEVAALGGLRRRMRESAAPS